MGAVPSTTAECLAWIVRRVSEDIRYINALRNFRVCHGNKYDYSRVSYVNAHTKVCIVCPTHGDFWQTPSNHYKRGCPGCKYDKMRSTLEDFLPKAREVHGDKYDYSRVDYKDTRTKVIILCPTHGEFNQTPAAHVYGKGCTQCGRDNSAGYSVANAVEGRYEYPGHIYLIRISTDTELFYKVGVTVNLRKRLAEIANDATARVHILYSERVEDMNAAVLAEAAVVSAMNSFVPSTKFGGYTECFTGFRKIEDPFAGGV